MGGQGGGGSLRQPESVRPAMPTSGPLHRLHTTPSVVLQGGKGGGGEGRLAGGAAVRSACYATADAATADR